MTLREDIWYEECSRCHGDGAVCVQSEWFICATCNTVGYIEHEHQEFDES